MVSCVPNREIPVRLAPPKLLPPALELERRQPS